MKSRLIKRMASLPAILFLTACGGGGGGSTTGDGNQSPSTYTGIVPDSGQTACYYDYIDDGVYIPLESTCLQPGSAWSPDGQDGYYNINPLSYTDNGDGTVDDNVTGLNWQKCSIGKTGTDCSAGAIASHDWNAASAQCASLSLDGGGWRLPSVTELTQLVNYGKSSGAIDSTAFPGTFSRYWTSTPTAHVNYAWAWYVDFTQSITWADNLSEALYVRCVRG